MGKVNKFFSSKIIIITPEQELLLNNFRKDPWLSGTFYFSGDTALSLHYLKHRQSIDLDFFSEEKFDQQGIIDTVTKWSKQRDFLIDYFFSERTQVFNLTFPNKQTTKIDFSLYPYKRVEKSKLIDGIAVDSLLDIAINKLLTVEQRTEVKDFVDLYFLLKEYTVWDLLEGLKIKFGIKVDPFILSSDFLKVESFDFLPTMIKPLSLEQLKSFFRQKAKDLSGKSLA